MSSTRRSSGADRALLPGGEGAGGGHLHSERGRPRRPGVRRYAAPPLPGRRAPLSRVDAPAPRRQPFAYLWPFEEAAKATLCMRGIPEIGSTPTTWRTSSAGRRTGSQYGSRGHPKPSYASYPPLPLGHGGDTYFDDNTWVAMDLVQAHPGCASRLMRGRGRPRTGARPVRAGRGRLVPDPRPYPGASTGSTPPGTATAERR